MLKLPEQNFCKQYRDFFLSVNLSPRAWLMFFEVWAEQWFNLHSYKKVDVNRILIPSGFGEIYNPNRTQTCKHFTKWVRTISSKFINENIERML